MSGDPKTAFQVSMRNILPVSSLRSAVRSLTRLALAGFLALAWTANSPAGFGSGPGNPAPIGLERADLGQAVLSQRLSGAFLVRPVAPDGGRASLSGDSSQASPPGEVSLPLPPKRGVSTIHAVQAPPDRAVHAYDARAPPIA